jgi:hypothetical protein
MRCAQCIRCACLIETDSLRWWIDLFSVDPQFDELFKHMLRDKINDPAPAQGFRCLISLRAGPLPNAQVA